MEVNKNIPHLAHFIAKRITNKIVALDCLVVCTGPKGSGKSTFCLSLGHEIAKELVKIKHKSELKGLTGNEYNKKMRELSDYYFNLEHVRSVDKTGTFQMFTSQTLRKENAVILADDFSITQNARTSQSNVNVNIQKVITVCRPFRTVLILNTVYEGLIDKSSRIMSDVQIHLLGVNPKTKTSIAKVFLHTTDQLSGKDYRKYFKWNGKRIKYWVAHLPPKDILDGYAKIRLDKTNEMIDSLDEMKQEQAKELKTSMRKKKGNDIIEKYRDEVLARHAAGESIRAISRISPDLSDWWVSKIISTKDDE